MKGIIVIINFLINVTLYCQQDFFSIKFKDTVVYEIIDNEDGSFYKHCFNKFKEISFSIEITHHLNDSIKPYCSPCNGFRKSEIIFPNPK